LSSGELAGVAASDAGNTEFKDWQWRDEERG
jgi:hypothetical protein